MNNGEFTLLLFASASTYIGGTETLKLPAPTTLSSVVQYLEQTYPGMTESVLKSCAWCVNLEYVDFEVNKKKVEEEKDSQEGDVKIQVDDEVAIIPPVSSG